MLVNWRDGSLFIGSVSKSQIDAPYLVWWRDKFIASRVLPASG
jgi:hypothetical protein